jgi:hypothetical protein
LILDQGGTLLVIIGFQIRLLLEKKQCKKMTNNDDLFYIAITYYIAINKNTEARFGRRGYHYLVPETTTVIVPYPP